MRVTSKEKGITCLIIIFVLTSIAFSQDMGVPDTIRIAQAIGDIEGEESYPFPVSVSVFNDNDLGLITIPLKIDGFSGWARFDSVSYIGSRLADVSVMDLRDVYSVGTDSMTMDSLLLSFEIASGNPLPIGDGKICDLWFRPIYGGDILIDSMTVAPYGSLLFDPEAGSEFIPQFQSGSIYIECDYIIGNIRPDGIDPILGFLKGYLGCFSFDWGDPWHADVNCDRLTDVRDVYIFYDYYFNESTTLCECGSLTPSYYNDPGIPDTVWIENETMFIGVPDTIDVGIINDEHLKGFAFALEWDGTAILGYGKHYWAAERLQNLQASLFSYQCRNYDQINPDTMHISESCGYFFNGIPPGSEAIIQFEVLPLTLGTVSFRLVNYVTDYDYMLTRGGQSMLVTEDYAGILPILIGGNITVLPRPCGDASGDGSTNVSDAVYIINYVFVGGNPPDPIELADVNCDGTVNVSDAVWIINFVFVGGNDPCDSDGDGEPDC
jgi:Dockerin type I domain